MLFYFSLILACIKSRAICSLNLLNQQCILSFLKQMLRDCLWSYLHRQCPVIGCANVSSSHFLSAIKILCYENDHARVQLKEGNVLTNCNFL